MEEREPKDKPLRDLIEIIHFTENVSAKIHGLMDEAEIYRTVKEEFAKSKRYTTTVLLLTDDGLNLRIAATSQLLGKLKAAEKVTGLKMKEYKIDLEKSSIFSKVVREGETFQVNFSDLIGEFLPRPLAHLVIKIMGHEKKSILTPLYRRGKIIGVFAMTSTELAEYFIPSVRNLAQHISTALELADEHTERKMMEKALEDQLRFLQHLIDTIPNPIFYKDTNGIFQGCNKAYEAFRGLPKEKILGKTVYDIDPKELADKYRQMDLELFRNLGVQVYEFTARHADGAKHDVIFNKATYTNADGAVAGLIGVMVDITERKRMEKELAYERDLLHALMDNIPDAVYFKDAASHFTRINRAHAKWMRVNDPRGALGKTDFDFYAEEFAREAYADEQKIVKIGQPLVDKIEKIRWTDGQIRWVSATKVPIKDNEERITGIVGISRDITERKNMEERIAYLASIVDNARVSIATVDMNGIVTYCNKATEEMLGWASKEAIGKPMATFCPNGGKQIEATVKEGFCLDNELEYVKSDGGSLVCSTSTFLMKDKNGNPIGVGGIAIDITARKKAEEALRESEAKLRGIFSSMTDGITLVGLDGGILDCNDAVLRLHGVSRDEYIGKNVFGFIAPEDREQAIQEASEVLEKEFLRSEVKALKKDGKAFDAEIYVSLLRNASGKPMAFLGVTRDITERKRMQNEIKRYSEHLEELVEEKTRQLREAERLAAIGETAAMVGHDLRNPLQVIVNTIYLLKNLSESELPQYKEGAKKRGYVDLFRTIQDQVEYMNKIVADLQDYARPVKPELAETGVYQLVNETLSTIAVPEIVEVSKMISEDLPRLVVDTVLMKRVFTNLITNALQAMPNGGQLTIKAHSTEEATFISFQDTGVGIPEENLSKLFQPLFTTKPKGTGFGLPVCKRLVEAQGGNITVESKVGRGSTFTVKIPLMIRGS